MNKTNPESRPIKKYQVWQREHSSTWYFNEFDSLKEAIESERYGDFFITALVNYEVKERNE
jgi:hypothetical protein